MHFHERAACFEVGPNRRAALEYSLFLVWLADQGDYVVDVLTRGLRTHQLRMADGLCAAEALDRYPPDAYQALLDSLAAEVPPDPDERRLMVRWLLDEYGDATLRGHYEAELCVSHVSLTAVRAFAQQTEDGFLLNRHPHYDELIPCQEFCSRALFDAMLAFNSLLVDKPWTAALMEIGTCCDLPTALPKRTCGWDDGTGRPREGH